MFRPFLFNTLFPPKYSSSNDKKKMISSKIDRVIAIYVLKNIITIIFYDEKLSVFNFYPNNY